MKPKFHSIFINSLAVSLFFIILTLFIFTRDSVPNKTISDQNAPTLDCVGHTPSSFSCYAEHYRGIAASQGVKAAIVELKTQTATDAYTKKECHLLMHEIGRATASGARSTGEAFKEGDQFCAGGYFHGVMEGFIQKHGTQHLSAEFLNSVCEPLITQNVEYQDCAHGLGHGVMYINNNELFDAITTCNLLVDKNSQRFCQTGVFMENVITDFRDHTTKYVKPEDPMYPCDAVEEGYKLACYSYQSIYFLKITGSFEKTFALCRQIPDKYQNVCFESIGRDATAGLIKEDILRTKENCLLGANIREQERCVVGAVRYIIANHQSETDGRAFCSVLSSSLGATCFDVATKYFKFITETTPPSSTAATGGF